MPEAHSNEVLMSQEKLTADVENRSSIRMEDFLKIRNCQRCGRGLITGRKMSWFNQQVICLHCLANEDDLKWKLKSNGFDPLQFEGCGYIPEVEKVLT